MILQEGKPRLTDSEFDDFFNAPVSLEQDKLSMNAALGPDQDFIRCHKTEWCPPSLEKNILRNAVIATGLQLEWNSGQEDAIYWNALSDYPTPMPHSPAPISQKYMQGDDDDDDELEFNDASTLLGH